MKRLIVLISALFSLGGTLISQVYLDTGGLVVMEIEGTPPVGRWESGNDISGFLGEGYYWWTGNFTNQRGIDVLEYHFRLEHAGTYRVALRNHNSNSDTTLDNDVFLGMDDELSWKLYSHGGASWSFHSMLEIGTVHAQPDYELEAGEHVLKISGRSANFRLDRIHIFDTSRWSNELATSIYHAPSPLENGTGIREIAARIFFSERTDLIPFVVYCDGSFSNGEGDNAISEYCWYDGNNEQRSISDDPLKTFYFYKPGEHEINLKVVDEDGNISEQSLTVTGTPRELGNLAPVTASASAVFANQVPMRSIDVDLDTSWTSPRVDEYIEYDFVRLVQLDEVGIMFRDRKIKQYTFDILASVDGENFDPILSGLQTSGNDDVFDTFALPAVQAHYLRIHLKDATSSAFISLEEVVFHGSPVPLTTNEAWQAQAIDYGQGIMKLPWLGYYWPLSGGWIYSLQHGWVYGSGLSGDSVYFWQESLGWFWTGSGTFPLLYIFETDSWNWFLDTSAAPDRWFYNMSTNEWFLIEG